MKITNFNPVMLENADRLTSGKNPYTDVYKLQNDRIFKMIKPPCSNGYMSLLSYKEFYKRFCQKLEMAKKLGTLDCLVAPDEVSVLEDGMVKGYFYPFNNSKTLDELNINERDFDFISRCFTDIASSVEDLHEHGIVVPDLFNASNILYDPITREVSFIDYDGMQVGNVPTNAISSMLEYRKNPILRNRKYSNRNNGLYTEKLDDLALSISYLYNLSGVNLASIPTFQELYSHEDDEDRYLYERYRAGKVLDSLGIDDSLIKDQFIDSFTTRENPSNAKSLIKTFSETYKHGNVREDGVRTFVRR